MAGLARGGGARLYAQSAREIATCCPGNATPGLRRVHGKAIVDQRVTACGDAGTLAAKALAGVEAARWGGTFEPMNAIRVAAWAAVLVGRANGAVNAQPEVASVSEVASSRVASLAIPHSKEAIKIDGVLDDAIWRAALALPLTIETYPRENATPEVETIAYLVENGDQLLIAFDARDPEPDKIRAYLRDRDSAFNDDFVGVVLDTFNDQRRAFEFFINPLGVQMDLINDDVNRSESESWDAIWDSAGQINDRGFAAEMAIPVQPAALSARGRRSDLGHRRAALSPARRTARGSRTTRRTAISPVIYASSSKFTGFANAEPGKALEVVPTLTATRTDKAAGAADDARSSGARRLRDRGRARRALGHHAGSDARSHVQSRLLASRGRRRAARGEHDVRVVVSRVAAVLPRGPGLLLDARCRPCTRALVADPDAGAKFTGRTGKNTIALFATNDAITNLLFPGPFGSQSTSLDQENDGFDRPVRARLRQDLADRRARDEPSRGRLQQRSCRVRRPLFHERPEHAALPVPRLADRVSRRRRDAVRASGRSRGRRVARRIPLRIAQLVRAGLAPGARPELPRATRASSGVSTSSRTDSR